MEKIVKVVWKEGREIRTIKGILILETEQDITIKSLDSREIKISKKNWIKTEEINKEIY